MGWASKPKSGRPTQDQNNTYEHAPNSLGPYQAGPKAPEFEKHEIDKMLKHQVISPAQTEWASPIVFTPEKDCTLRFCIDYSKPYAVTICNLYPIPRMGECINSLGDVTIFLTLDVKTDIGKSKLG